MRSDWTFAAATGGIYTHDLLTPSYFGPFRPVTPHDVSCV
jgi:hypothetical protein